jgi:hypothetical protein
MDNKRGGLLAQIEADVADYTAPLSSLLQKCIVLGGQARVGEDAGLGSPGTARL